MRYERSMRIQNAALQGFDRLAHMAELCGMHQTEITAGRLRILDRIPVGTPSRVRYFLSGYWALISKQIDRKTVFGYWHEGRLYWVGSKMQPNTEALALIYPISKIADLPGGFYWANSIGEGKDPKPYWSTDDTKRTLASLPQEVAV